MHKLNKSRCKHTFKLHEHINDFNIDSYFSGSMYTVHWELLICDLDSVRQIWTLDRLKIVFQYIRN